MALEEEKNKTENLAKKLISIEKEQQSLKAKTNELM